MLAVSLGGSRSAGTARPDSDWDFAVYYRGAAFDPQSLRLLGWPGQIFPIGGWGGGAFNGGAWLTAGDRRVDVHYRDLDDVEYRLAEARAGRFGIERLMFHLAGMPTYIVVAELARHRVLHGDLPRPAYPPALRRAAAARWHGDALATLDYARTAHAARGHLADTAGGSPPRPVRARTPCWRRAASGSPTRRRCSTRPGCAAPTRYWPGSPPSQSAWWRRSTVP